MVSRCHNGSSLIFFLIKYLMASETRAINSVPGVIQFESNALVSLGFVGGAVVAANALRVGRIYNDGAEDRGS